MHRLRPTDLTVRRARARGAVALVVLSGLLAGCSASADAQEPRPTTPAASASATPSPTPSATPAPQSPVAAIAGGCAAIATSTGVAAAAGGIQSMVTLDELWQLGIQTAGGVTCGMLTSRVAAHVYVIPETLVTDAVAALTAAPACEEGAQAMECRAAATAGGNTTLVVGSFTRTADTVASLAALTGLADAVSALTDGGAPAAPTKTTWERPIDCDAISRTIGMSSILSSARVRPALPQNDKPTVESRLAAATSIGARCDWSKIVTDETDPGSRLSVVTVPDGAWAWPRVAGGVPDSTDATVAGYPARVTSSGEIYLSDGVNIVHIYGAGLAGIGVADTAPGVMSVLTAGASETRD